MYNFFLFSSGCFKPTKHVIYLILKKNFEDAFESHLVNLKAKNHNISSLGALWGERRGESHWQQECGCGSCGSNGDGDGGW